MTLREYLLLDNANRLKEENEWDRTRNVMTAIINYAGFGASEAIAVSDVIQLSKDLEDVIKPISSVDQARVLIDNM
ncbi:hypothetical protein ORI89_18830 [Sphingobacterium sp. UT-1RO-CII-1]|uniref:hypothetical protein n=1 Tax=Sphingobacterium sp. UT-1RO-CII-1 TaxID=2995225 RepID=UPI00227A98D2|nr:hypothetical protein [Sphingobacterium sp. UT-1RO-CII-1]MCY4781713.1 hypothetical protein [Sphingobacterium sp. UT-1RO-CII-1]